MAWSHTSYWVGHPYMQSLTWFISFRQRAGFEIQREFKGFLYTGRIYCVLFARFVAMYVFAMCFYHFVPVLLDAGRCKASPSRSLHLGTSHTSVCPAPQINPSAHGYVHIQHGSVVTYPYTYRLGTVLRSFC